MGITCVCVSTTKHDGSDYPSKDVRRVTYTRPVLHQHVGQSFPGRAIQADGLPPPFILQIFWKGKQTTNPHYNKVLCHANPPKKYDTSYNRVETG